MHSSLTAVVLCIFAQVAGAQYAAAAPLDHDARKGTEVIHAKTRTATTTPHAHQGGELIKSAAAGTREPPGARPAAMAMHNTPDAAKSDKEHPARSETAMLLTALALMSGIVLRRFGANKQ